MSFLFCFIFPIFFVLFTNFDQMDTDSCVESESTIYLNDETNPSIILPNQVGVFFWFYFHSIIYDENTFC